MNFRKTLLAATMLALPLAAQAQPVTGLYVAGGAGANWRNNVSDNFTTAGVGTPFALRASSGVGFVGLGSVGWGFGNGLRLELEGNYRSNDVDAVRTQAFGLNLPSTARTGYMSTMGIMGNVLYDIGSTMRWPVFITVGGGVGYAWNRLSSVGSNIAAPAGSSTNININGTDGSFAYQGILGLTLPIAAVPGLAFTLEYRYFATLDSSHNATVSTVNGTTGVISQTRGGFNASNQNQSALIGVRYNFGQAPRPAPVAAAPAPARSFLVFFDFARDDLTARAREIIGQAAQASRSQQVTRIEVAGHTDTVGSAQYNQGLSQRRANNVAAELVRLGVPRQSIQTAAYGFTRPLVPTGPNVREPQNRRVEIVLR